MLADSILRDPFGDVGGFGRAGIDEHIRHMLALVGRFWAVKNVDQRLFQRRVAACGQLPVLPGRAAVEMSDASHRCTATHPAWRARPPNSGTGRSRRSAGRRRCTGNPLTKKIRRAPDVDPHRTRAGFCADHLQEARMTTRMLRAVIALLRLLHGAWINGTTFERCAQVPQCLTGRRSVWLSTGRGRKIGQAPAASQS